MVFIRHVLSSMLLHVWATMKPTVYVCDRIEKLLGKFFWGTSEWDEKRHWASWRSLCYPTIKNGLNVRSVHDLVKAFLLKLWWKYKSQGCLWAEFIASLPASKRGCTSWKRISAVDSLAVMHAYLIVENGNDQWIWKPKENGQFSLSSAFNVCRQRMPPISKPALVWNKRIPLKISIYSWRVLNGFICSPKLLRYYGISLVSRCVMYKASKNSFHHANVFCSRVSAMWRHFTSLFGIIGDFGNVWYMIDAWWALGGSSAMAVCSAILPSVLM